MPNTFHSRAEAGRSPSRELARYAGRCGVLVVALPRGGAVVGCEVARALGVDYDLLVVRKLGLPRREELALGAIASGDVQCRRN